MSVPDYQEMFLYLELSLYHIFQEGKDLLPLIPIYSNVNINYTLNQIRTRFSYSIILCSLFKCLCSIVPGNVYLKLQQFLHCFLWLIFVFLLFSGFWWEEEDWGKKRTISTPYFFSQYFNLHFLLFSSERTGLF